MDFSTWERDYFAKTLGPTKKRCARGHGPMVGYELKFEEEAVEVDACRSCGALWLDRDEGGKLSGIIRSAREHAVNKEQGVDRPGAKHYIFQLLTGFPMEVWNPVKRKPVVLYGLMVLLPILYGLEVIGNSTVGEVWVPYFLCVPAEIREGRELWTILTCGFLHGGVAHLLGNLYFLWIFGDNVEDALGPRRFLVLYIAALLVGSLAHIAFNLGSTVPLVGASGAIAGLMGAYLVLFPKVKMWVVLMFIRFRIGVVWYLGFWVGMQLLMVALGGQGTAWWAHLGGFAVGLALGLYWRQPARFSQPIAV